MKTYVLHTLWLCGLYAVTSIASSLTLKFLFSVFKFQDTILVLTHPKVYQVLFFESTFNIIVCFLFSLNKEPEVEKPKEDTPSHFKRTVIYSLIYLGQVFCGMKALSLVSIPMFFSLRITHHRFNTLRRTLVFFVFLVTQFSNPRSVSSSFGISVLLITGGALLAGYDHFEEEYAGYSLVLLTNLLTAVSLQITSTMPVGALQLVYRNSINIWPILLVAVLVSDEAHDLVPEFLVCLILLSAFGLANAFATNRCAMEISPIAIAITHNVKDIFSTSISMWMFNDLHLDQLLITGFLVSFAGSTLYTYTKFSELSDKHKGYQPVPPQDK